MSHPIIVTREAANIFRLRIADGSEGLSHSKGIVLAGADSVLNVLAGLLGETTLDVEGQPWAATYEAMRQRLVP